MTRLASTVAVCAAAAWMGGCGAGQMGKRMEPFVDSGCTFTPIAIPQSRTAIVHDNTAWGVPGTSGPPDSKVWRTDLASGAVAFSKDLGQPIQQLAFVGGELWACTRSWWAIGPGMTIQLLDPTSLARKDSVRITSRMLSTGNAVFDCTDDPPALIPIDMSTHRPLAPIALDPGFGAIGPICDGPKGEVYVLGTFSGMLARVNVSRHRVEAQAHVGQRAVHPVSMEGILRGPGQGGYFGLTLGGGKVQVMSTRHGDEEIIACDATTCQPLSRGPHLFEAGAGMLSFDGWLWGTCHVKETALSWAASKTIIVARDAAGVRADRVIDPRLNGRLIEGGGRLWFFAGDQLCRIEMEGAKPVAESGR